LYHHNLSAWRDIAMEGKRDPLNQYPEPQWPQRLFHIPTMTSHQRTEGNIYGSHKEPPYYILSYTWGRWRSKKGPALNVQGISWRVPRVQHTHFSVDDFESVLQRMTSEYGADLKICHVWLDVACIDQEVES